MWTWKKTGESNLMQKWRLVTLTYAMEWMSGIERYTP